MLLALCSSGQALLPDLHGEFDLRLGICFFVIKNELIVFDFRVVDFFYLKVNLAVFRVNYVVK